jgi:hypothetical protein
MSSGLTVCAKPAVVVYVWPTMDRLPCCEAHRNAASGIATVMGFRLGTLPVAAGETCTQRVKEAPND